MLFTLSLVALLFVGVFAVNAFAKNSVYAGEYPDEFPLAIDLERKVFFSWETISITAMVTNNSGEDLEIVSNGSYPDGSQPTAYLLRINDKTYKAITANAVHRSFKSGEVIAIKHEYKVKPGIYVLDVVCSFQEKSEWETPPEEASYTNRMMGKLDSIIIIVL